MFATGMGVSGEIDKMNRQLGLTGETAKQFQWDSRDNTCSHHGASHAAGGRRRGLVWHLAGIIRPAEQGECLQAESGSRVLGSGGAN